MKLKFTMSKVQACKFRRYPTIFITKGVSIDCLSRVEKYNFKSSYMSNSSAWDIDAEILGAASLLSRDILVYGSSMS